METSSASAPPWTNAPDVVPRITALKRSRRRGWREVELDGAHFCRLPEDAVEETGLAEGDELSPARLTALRDEAHRRDAMDRALHYLGHRPRSRFEVERHLRRRGYVESAVAAAVERCLELGVLDDREYAAAHARDRIRSRPRAPARIASELRKRGVSAEDARAGIARALEEMGTSEAELLRRAAEKKVSVLRARDPEARRRRLYGYLRRRGFRHGAIREIMDELLNGPRTTE